MLYAIDKYQLGKEKEVSASSFYGTYINNKHNRFFCPECGEPVFWRSRGGSKPDMFVHKKKTNYSPECEKRVDGQVSLSLYERVGLPLYIEEVSEGKYILKLSFPPLGNTLRNVGEAAYVTVSTKNHERKVKLDESNFFKDYRTLIPVNFIPSYEEKYSISVIGANNRLSIMQIWPDYADGFDVGGAIFDIDSNVGRKKRRGDNIEPNRDYLVVAKSFQPIYSEINTKKVGIIKLNEQIYNVYRVNANVSTDIPGRFVVIDSFFKRVFGVGLLEKVPTLMPLWPPMVDTGVLSPIKDSNSIYCAIISANDEPNIYEYSGNTVFSHDYIEDNNGTFSIRISLGEDAKTLSVDRKYVGSEVVFQKQILPLSSYDYEYFFYDKNEELISIDYVGIAEKNELVFESNAKMDLYFCYTNGTSKHVSIREKLTEINVAGKPTTILLRIANRFIVYVPKYQMSQLSEYVYTSENELLDMLKRNNHGALVDIPSFVVGFKRKCENKKYYELSRFIETQIARGKISIGMLAEISDILVKTKQYKNEGAN